MRLTVTSHAATTLMARLLGFRLLTGLSLFAVILLWLNLISIVHVTSSIAYRAPEQVSEHSLVPPQSETKSPPGRDSVSVWRTVDADDLPRYQV